MLRTQRSGIRKEKKEKKEKKKKRKTNPIHQTAALHSSQFTIHK
jgi:hypothetical protein